MPTGACGIRKPLLQHWREMPPGHCRQRAMDKISAINNPKNAFYNSVRTPV